ncbi:hypothetical protein [Microbispora rosea]|uniref:hypothetical protein n=1 Tax=Microbispora rosea TaxID=58117 RepID=UPI003426D718
MSTVVPVPLTARNAGLAELHALLRDQHARKVDIPVTTAQIRAAGTHLQLIDTPPVLSEAGVSDSAGLYLPTEICDQGLADKLGIPLPYLRRLRAHQPALYEANVNTWLRSDDRRFLLRGLRGAGDAPGVARAFSCPTATKSLTTWTCSWPPWTAYGWPGSTSTSTGAT